jgi:hypothetical protein
MATAAGLTENSHQGFEAEKPPRIRLDGRLSRNMRWGYGHIYDETPVEIAVYVRNDPINRMDPDGHQDECSPGVDFCVVVNDIPPSNPEYYIGSGGPYFYDITQYYNQSLAIMMYTGSISTSSLQSAWQGVQYLWMQLMYGVNTNITNDQRWTEYSNALSQVQGRMTGGCLDFINRVINKLGSEGMLNSTIKSAQDLLNVASSSLSVNVYGAAANTQLSPGSPARGYHFALTQGNTIYLGEDFFNPGTYAAAGGGDQVSTLIHEFFHLLSVGNGKQLEEGDLNNVSDTKNFGNDMRTDCGPPN